VLGAALVAVCAVLPARSAPTSHETGAPKDEVSGAAVCSAPLTGLGGHGFTYCGDHWRLSKLPVRFRVNQSGAPPAIASDFVLAADLAALAWNVAAPVRGSGPRPNRCDQTTAVVCLESAAYTGGVNPTDGVNTIVWQSLGATAAPGYAVFLQSGQRIADVDIVLNSSLNWYWGDAALASGVALGPVAPLCPRLACPMRYDIQAILTHEFGHALGLLHVNPGSPALWPSDAADAPDYNLVMYQQYYPNNATQRVLGWGDIAGLQAVMLVSSGDP